MDTTRNIFEGIKKKLILMFCALAAIVILFPFSIKNTHAATTRYVYCNVSINGSTTIFVTRYGDAPQAWFSQNNHNAIITGKNNATAKGSSGVDAIGKKGNWNYVKVQIDIPKGWYFPSGSATSNYENGSSAVQFTTPNGQTSYTTNNGLPTSHSDQDRSYVCTLYWLNTSTAPGTTKNDSRKYWNLQRASFTVKFYDANGNAYNTQSILYGDSATAPSGPSRTGYTFAGWDRGYSGVTSDLNVYPKWTANTYTVKYNGNGNTGGSTSDSSHTYNAAKNLTANGFTKTGYTFAGWATSANGSVAYSNSQSVTNLATSGTVNLYAKWTANTYTVKYNGNGNTGGSTADSSHTYDTAKALTSNGYTKTGYTFAGWATTSTGNVAYSNGQSVKNLVASGNTTLYAKWTANTYTVKYNGNGNTGGSTADSSHTYDTAKNLTANGFTKTGYRFIGWSTSASGNVVYANSASVKNLTATNSGTVTLYAKWEAETYTVKYNGNGNTGGSTADSSHYLGVAKNLTTNGYTKTGYTFAGWATSATGSVVYADGASVTNLTTTAGTTVNLYAKWTANTYTVKYNGNGNTGGSTADSNHTYDVAKALTSNGYTKTGYTFAGWATSSTGSVAYSNGQSVTNLATSGTVTLYAKWTANTYTIKYNGNGNTGGSTADSSHIYNTAKNLTANGYTKTGYTFAGWATNSTGNVVYSNSQSVTNLATGGTVNLYAKWTPISYTVKYNGNGNTGGSTADSNHVYDTAKNLTANGFTKTNYHFIGWATTASGNVAYSNNASVKNLATTNGTTVTLYAKWEQDSYSVKYNGNGNTGGSMSNSTHYVGVAKNLTANGFTKTGYTFAGWATSASGSVVYGNSASVTNLTKTHGATVNLYAKWTANKYTIEYNGNGNTGGSTVSSSHVYDTERTLTANGFTKTGYIFAGWAISASGNVVYKEKAAVKNINSTNNGKTTLYAKWTPITYTVTYDGNGATSGTTANSSHTYDVNKALTSNGFKKTGRSFVGWATSADGPVEYANNESVKNLTTKNGSTVTLYAKWDSNKYTVHYNGNSSDSGSTADSIHEADVPAKLTANGFSKDGYHFIGWATSANGNVVYQDKEQVNNIVPEGSTSITLYAKWEINTYKIAYNGNGATAGTTQTSTHTYNQDKALTANGYARTGYVFAGWSTSSNGSVEYQNSATVKNLTKENNKTIILYAKWTPNTYTVKYNGNGSTSGSTASSSHVYGTSKVLSENGFSKKGYSFAGWSSSPDGQVQYSNKQSVSNLTATNGATVELYAKWNPNVYTIKYKGNGSTDGSTSNSTHKYGVASKLSANGYIKKGYDFKGWATSASGQVMYSDQETVTNLIDTNGDTVTLYAVWSKKTSGNTEDSGDDLVLNSSGPRPAVGQTENNIIKVQYVGAESPTDSMLKNIGNYNTIILDQKTKKQKSLNLDAFNVIEIDKQNKYVYAEATYNNETVKLKISYTTSNEADKYIPEGTTANKELTEDGKTINVIFNDTTRKTQNNVTKYETKDGFTTASTEYYNEKKPCSITLVKFGPDGKNKLKGVTFKIQKKDGSAVKDIKGNILTEKTTDENGMIRFENLPTDTYVITETKTLEGMQLLANQIIVELPMSFTEQEVADKNVDKTKAFYNEADGKYYLYDCKYEISNSVNMTLPKTGGFPVYIAAIIGTILILLVIARWFFVKRKQDMTE